MLGSPCCWSCVLLQFEKAENKPVVIGYVAAAIFAFFTAEWLIHLPALDVVSDRTTTGASSAASCTAATADARSGAHVRRTAARACLASALRSHELCTRTSPLKPFGIGPAAAPNPLGPSRPPAAAAVQILGFPVQLVGLLTLPYLGVRWFVDGQSAGKDIEEAVVSADPMEC